MKVNAGDRVRWRGDECTVIVIRTEFITLRTSVGEEIDVAFDAVTESVERIDPPLLSAVDLESLSPHVTRDLRIWHAAVIRYDEAIASGLSRSEALDREAGRVGDALSRAISTRTMERQISAFRRQGITGLLDRRAPELRASRKTRADPRIVSLIEEALTGRKRASTTSRSYVIDEVTRRARLQYGDTITVPSRSSFYRLLEDADRGRASFGSAKTRESLALQPDRAFSSTFPSRPGEQTQIDSTVLDVMVRIDESTVARPELTILIDVATRSILSAVLRPQGTKGVDIVIALARALVPYSRRPEGARQTRHLISQSWAEDVLIDQERYDQARNAQPYIFPDEITTDRGRNFLSHAFRSACDHLSISYVTANSHTPTDKPHVERTFKSINTLFLQYAKGYVGRSVEHRGKDAVTESNQLLTIHQMQELLEDWIAVHWQNRPHDGLRHPAESGVILSPNQMFRAFREVAPELHVPLTQDDFIRMLPTIHRRVNEYGVTIDHRHYDSELLSDYRRRSSPDKTKNGRWSIRVDPYNLHVVWLDTGDSFLPLYWANHVHESPMLGEVWRIALAHYRQDNLGDSSGTQDLVEAIRTFAGAGNPALSKREKSRIASIAAIAADPMSAARLTGGDRVAPGRSVEPKSDDVPAHDGDAPWPHSGGFTLITYPVDEHDEAIGE